MAKPILGFPTQGACRVAIKAIVDPHRKTGNEFESELVSDLFALHHYGCKKHGLRPQKFKWDIHPTLKYEDCFTAYFGELGWRVVSWAKAIERWELNESTLNGAIKERFRQEIKPIIVAYRTNHIRCERCGGPVHDIDHVSPEFDGMASDAIGLLSPEERKAIIENYNWLNVEPFELPEKCRQAIFDAHKDAQLMAVCFPCHIKNARERRDSK